MVDDVIAKARRKLPVPERKNPLPTTLIRVECDGQHYFVAGFSEADYERLVKMGGK